MDKCEKDKRFGVEFFSTMDSDRLYLVHSSPRFGLGSDLDLVWLTSDKTSADKHREETVFTLTLKLATNLYIDH